MKLRSRFCRALCVWMLILGVVSGCSVPSADTGPTEEPNRGPGMPAGGPPSAGKSDAKADNAKGASTKDAAKK